MISPTKSLLLEETDSSRSSASPLQQQRTETYQIQKELDRRTNQNPLKYYWPHQKNCDGHSCRTAQLTFETYDGKRYTIRGCPQYDFASQDKFIRAFFGSNRAGKTTAGAVETGYHTTGEYPPWWKGHDWDRPTIGRIFCSDFAKGAKNIAKKLKEWLPKEDIIHVGRNNQRAEVEWWIKHRSGGTSYFDVMTYEQESDLAEGSDQDWVWFDEPPPRAMYIAATRGLVDRDGICYFTLTPLKEPWLFDEIYNSRHNEVYSVICDMRHNLKRMNPLTGREIGLKEEAIRRFERRLTEEERETRMHGKFRYLAGRIWKEWERDVHTFDRSKWVVGKDGVLVDGEPPVHWPRMMLIDPHDRNPHALLWVACDETDNYWIYREGWLANAIIEDVVAYIKTVELRARERVGSRVMDPNFGPKRYGNSGLTVRDELEAAGRKLNYSIRFAFGDDRKEIARKAVASLLKFDIAKPISLFNHPKIMVANDLRECIHQVEHYVWDEFKSAMERDPKEKPRETNSHFPDLLQYFALTKFGWRKPKLHEGRGNFYG